jgi:hypothetical protein
VGHPAFGKVVLCQNPVHGLARLQRFAHLSEMTGREQALTLDDILPLAGNEQVLAAARQMVATPRGWLYIWGGPGNAKSDVLCAIVNELNRSGHGPALYIKWTRLANLMSESFAERRYRGAMLSSGVAPGSSAFANLGYLDRFERLVRLPRIHRHCHGNTTAECREKQGVRIRTGIFTAGCNRFIRRQCLTHAVTHFVAQIRLRGNDYFTHCWTPFPDFARFNEKL